MRTGPGVGVAGVGAGIGGDGFGPVWVLELVGVAGPWPALAGAGATFVGPEGIGGLAGFGAVLGARGLGGLTGAVCLGGLWSQGPREGGANGEG